MSTDSQVKKHKVLVNDEVFDVTIISEEHLERIPELNRHDEIKLMFDFMKNSALCLGLAYAALLFCLHYEALLKLSTLSNLFSKEPFVVFWSGVLVLTSAVLYIANLYSFTVQIKKYSNLGVFHYLSVVIFMVATSSAIMIPLIFH